MTKLKIALFGAGRMGVIHARTVTGHENAELAFIADPNVEARDRLAKRHGAQVTDTDGVFADRSIDAVIVASAASTHADLIERAAATGKAVFCEKPIGRGYAQVKRAVATVEEASISFMLGFNRRFDPHFCRLARQLQDGDIGALELAVLTSRDPAPPPIAYVREAGGIFRETTVHDIDVARWLFAEDPVSVFAAASAMTSEELRAEGFADTVALTLTMPSGALAIINNSWRSAYGYDQRVEVHGASGMLRLENVPRSTVARAGYDGIVTDVPEPFFTERYGEAYAAEIDAFIGGLATGDSLKPDHRDGFEALRIAEAAVHSVTTGAPVMLKDWEPDDA